MISILLGGAFGLIGTLLGTRVAIGLLARKGLGQYVRERAAPCQRGGCRRCLTFGKNGTDHV